MNQGAKIGNGGEDKSLFNFSIAVYIDWCNTFTVGWVTVEILNT